jgi:hypothetical protein
MAINFRIPGFSQIRQCGLSLFNVTLSNQPVKAGDKIQDQSGIQMGCENGWDVFTVDYTMQPFHFAME